MKTIHLENEFDKFFAMLKRGENFALLRYGDGERGIMTGQSFTAQEGWRVGADTEFAHALAATLQLRDERVFYGISCPCCDFVAAYWYQQHILNSNLTFANLWVNKNYRRFRASFDELKRDAVLIANYRARGAKIGNLNILKHYEIGDNCAEFYKNDLHALLAQIKQDLTSGALKGRKNLLFAISAGPLAEIIISELFSFDKAQCYVDFGSALDEYYKDFSRLKSHRRPYTIAGNEYAERNCYLELYDSGELDISVVLNLYKRPYALPLQLRALRAQSLQPREILLYQDGVFEGICVPKECEGEFDKIQISHENKGVWARFDFARGANSNLVCVFDDDTVPGRDFLANCFYQMRRQSGLYGSIGVVLEDAPHYPAGSAFFRLGWAHPTNECAEVDFVGHSWFFKKEWLGALFDERYAAMRRFKTAGEDMCFSLALQRLGVKSFVPPHPFGNKHLWGADAGHSFEFGDDKAALSVDDGANERMNAAMRELLRLGFVPLKERDLGAFKRAKWLNNKALSKQNGGVVRWKLKQLERFLRHKIKRFLGVKKYQ